MTMRLLFIAWLAAFVLLVAYGLYLLSTVAV